MNLIQILALVNKYRPAVGLVGLALYHLAAQSSLKDAAEDLEQAAAELGVPVGQILGNLGPLIGAMGLQADPPK